MQGEEEVTSAYSVGDKSKIFWGATAWKAGNVHQKYTAYFKNLEETISMVVKINES